MNDTEKLADARRVFDVEIEALRRTRDALDETFVQILDLVTGCKGRVILTGMGKPGHIAAKLAATLASLGTPAFHLHPAEALHGDLGMVGPQDSRSSAWTRRALAMAAAVPRGRASRG